MNLTASHGRGDLTAHGFRSTFRDWAAESTTCEPDVVEMALAHTVANKVESAYRRGDLFEKRRPLMADWAAFCAGALHRRRKSTTLKRNRAVAEVIPFKIESAQGNRAACQRRRILTAGLIPAIRRSVAAYDAADTRLNLDLRQAEYNDAVDVEDAAIYRVAETPAGNYADIKAKARVLTVSEARAGGGSPSFSLGALVELIMADLEQIEGFA